jgi:hypothetical protein
MPWWTEVDVRDGLLFLTMLFVALPASAQHCTVKEYAQYKDLATSPKGQYWLASDYCDAERVIESADARARLAVQYGAVAKLHEAQADAQGCLTVMGKTRDALMAAGAEDWIKYAYGHCQGQRPSLPAK